MARGHSKAMFRSDAPAMRILLILLLFALPARAQSWLAESAQTIPSTDTPWGGIALDQDGSRLFIARQADGLLVWNTKTREARTVADSKGVTTIVLVPAAARAYAVTIEGALLTIDMASLKLLDRTDLGAGDIAHAILDPGQNRVHLVTGPRPEKSTWITVDAATGQVLTRTEFNSRAMAMPAIGPDGEIFAPMRDRALLQQLDPKDLSVHKTWRLGECQQPAATLWDRTAKRVLIACRGEKPVFVALDPAAGIVATIPIGRGADGIAFDPVRRLVVIANGVDGTLSVIRQDGPNDYAATETTTTRPGARVLAMDDATRRLFTVAATTTQPAGEGKPPQHHPDSFTIITYRAP